MNDQVMKYFICLIEVGQSPPALISSPSKSRTVCLDTGIDKETKRLTSDEELLYPSSPSWRKKSEVILNGHETRRTEARENDDHSLHSM